MPLINRDVYMAKSIRDLELELSIFKQERKSCFNPKRIHWIEEHIDFLEQILTLKLKT